MKLATLALFIGAVGALELTPDNFDAQTAGKTVFLKFFAPWCGHCKAMKPDWDKLMKEFKGHKSILVADIDCTTEGKALCDANGVKGFPTLKWGDASSLEDYSGGRDFKSLHKFASELKPVCSPTNLDLCDEEGRAKIEAIQALTDEELDAAISQAEARAAEAEATFKAEVTKLQNKYESLQKEKEATLKAIKEGGLGVQKAVQAARKKAKKEEL